MSATIDDAIERVARGEGDDAALFDTPPPREDCPICYQPLPDINWVRYQVCCGKVICAGCIESHVAVVSERILPHKRTPSNAPRCPFCNTPGCCSDKENLKKLKERVKINDPMAVHTQGCYYFHGTMGEVKDAVKGIQCWQRAAELGSIDAHYDLSWRYLDGEGVQMNIKTFLYHARVAAMCGHIKARFNLGFFELEQGKIDQAIRHWMISAVDGCDEALTNVKKAYMEGHVTKAEFERALRAHKDANDDQKNIQRDKAATVS